MTIAGENPYAWETKEGNLKYSRDELAEYNKRYNNEIGDEEGLYTPYQVKLLLTKFLVEMHLEDVDGLSTLKTIVGKSGDLVKKQSEKLVDEFVEGGEEE
ncbi:hypothetical protein [Weissella cibaria]|uniref:hypothetical protein n=1 Tax=Weissella cibaria TaxID=137591 RepID=UPI0013DB6A11|nr:hypothetical protein [Weissella cibaria]NFA02007.1 hypothetical protein [Weissella cibaria]